MKPSNPSDSSDTPTSESLEIEPIVAVSPMILVVEDDPDISRTITLRLEMHGFRVCHAFDAVLAMDVALNNRPSLVILDVSMPGGDGFDVAKRLEADPLTAGTPVIFLTASMRPDLPVRAAASGASAFIRKPYDSAELISEVRRLTCEAYEIS